MAEFTYTGRLLATPNPISLADSGRRAYQQIGGVAVEPDLWPMEEEQYLITHTKQWANIKSFSFSSILQPLDSLGCATQ